jgi:hypothetical protein
MALLWLQMMRRHGGLSAVRVWTFAKLRWRPHRRVQGLCHEALSRRHLNLVREGGLMQEILAALDEHALSKPLRQISSRREDPQYHRIIRKPMDLATMKVWRLVGPRSTNGGNDPVRAAACACRRKWVPVSTAT